MKKLLYVLVGLAILVAVLFTYLGAFTSAEVVVKPSEEMYVAGIPFEGHVSDEKFSNAFRRAAELRDKGDMKGILGNIYYNNPESESESIKAFIGLIVPDSAVNLPDGYELRVVPARQKVVQASATANVLFLPKKLYSAVFDYAKEQNLQLESFYMEWFPEDDKGVVEIPVKE